MKKREKKSLEAIDYTKKERLLMAALTSLAVTFTYFLYGPIDIYSNNMAELAITFKDIILPVIIAFLFFFAAFTAVLYIFKSNAVNVATAAIISLFISGLIDNNITNKVVYTSGDTEPLSVKNQILFFGTYLVVLYITVFAALLLKKKWKSVLVFLCILLLGTNAAALAGDFAKKDLINDTSINCSYVVSKKGLFEVSEKENIIVILFDRLDTKYFDSVNKLHPGYFDNMDGFTYYDSATTSYSRTFPAVTALITNNMYNADITPEEYFKSAYTNSPFLKDLKSNGYNVNLYIDRYYEYTDAAPLKDTVDNVEPVTGYVPDKLYSWRYLTKLSIDRNFSLILANTSLENAAWGRNSQLSELVCEDGIYHDNDEELYRDLKSKGLSASGDDKNFTFLYLHGSHTPIVLGEDCTPVKNATVESQTTGAFKIVFEYLEQLKKLGVYDNSTIVITADHGYAISDTDDYFKVANSGITACMFVKPRGAKNKKLLTSSKEISITNLVPAIVQDAGLKTDYKYEKSVFDIKEGEHVRRTLYQSTFANGHNLCLNEYEIYGDAKDLKNWTLKQRIITDYAWY